MMQRMLLVVAASLATCSAWADVGRNVPSLKIQTSAFRRHGSILQSRARKLHLAEQSYDKEVAFLDLQPPKAYFLSDRWMKEAIDLSSDGVRPSLQGLMFDRLQSGIPLLSQMKAVSFLMAQLTKNPDATKEVEMPNIAVSRIPDLKVLMAISTRAGSAMAFYKETDDALEVDFIAGKQDIATDLGRQAEAALLQEMVDRGNRAGQQVRLAGRVLKLDGEDSEYTNWYQSLGFQKTGDFLVGSRHMMDFVGLNEDGTPKGLEKRAQLEI